MDVEVKVRSLIFSIGILLISLYILLSGLPIISLVPLLLTIPIYIFGVSFGRIMGSLLLSSLIMIYMVLEGVQIYYVGVLFTLLALIYEPKRGVYEHKIVYLVIGVSILMAAYLAVIYRFMGLPSLYRFIYLIWGGMLVVAWIYIYSSPKTAWFFDLTRFREYYLRFIAQTKTIGIGIIYLVLVVASLMGGFLLGVLISLIGLYLIYRRIYSLNIAGLLIFLYIILSIFYGIDKAFIELDGLIRSVGGWLG